MLQFPVRITQVSWGSHLSWSCSVTSLLVSLLALQPTAVSVSLLALQPTAVSVSLLAL